MEFLAGPLQKALFAGSLLTSIALSVACGTTATPTPTSAPTSTPRPTVAVQLQRPQPLATQVTTPTPLLQPTITSAPSPTPTSVPRLPVPTLAVPPTRVPTITPTSIIPLQTPVSGITKLDKLMDFVEKNYFKEPWDSMEILYPSLPEHSNRVKSRNFNLGIPYKEAFMIYDTGDAGFYGFYVFLYPEPSVTNRFSRYRDELLQKGWKTYRDGIFGENSDGYTWISFESERAVTITTSEKNLGEAIDAYILRTPGIKLNIRYFAEKFKGILPADESSITSVSIDKAPFGSSVEVNFRDLSGEVFVVARGKPIDIGYVQTETLIKDYGTAEIGGYNSKIIATKTDFGIWTHIYFDCKPPEAHCRIIARWDLVPSLISIRERLNGYMTTLAQSLTKKN